MYSVCVLPSILCNVHFVHVPFLLQIVPCECVPTYSPPDSLAYNTCYIVFFLFQTQLPTHEPKVETGKDHQAMEAKLERYRRERNMARNELQTLQRQLEQKMIEAERGGSVTAQYEGRIQELETMTANADRKHEEHIQKLTKEFENILAQKEQARMRTFGEDPSSSVQQMEAIYQNQLQQKDKELRDRERDFKRRQNHYLTQISQLEAARDEATKREEEARTEVERIKMEHHSQLHRLQVPHAQPGVSELCK